jgi:hypothetical protein
VYFQSWTCIFFDFHVYQNSKRAMVLVRITSWLFVRYKSQLYRPWLSAMQISGVEARFFSVHRGSNPTLRWSTRTQSPITPAIHGRQHMRRNGPRKAIHRTQVSSQLIKAQLTYSLNTGPAHYSTNLSLPHKETAWNI